MTNPVKCLRVITRLNVGGPAIHAVLLSSALDTERFATTLVSGALDEGEGDLSEAAARTGVRHLRCPTLCRPMAPWRDAVTFVWLLRLIWRDRPQIVHTHLAKAGALGRLAAWLYNTLGSGRRAGRRAVVVHTFHGHVLDSYFSPWLSRFFITIERWLARRTDCLIAVSPAVRDSLLQLEIGRPDQWRVVRLGLNLAPFADLPMPQEAGAVRLGMVGRLVPIKNPSLLLQAVTRIHRRWPDGVASSVIVGDGPLRPQLEREAGALGIQPLVRFTGWQRDLPSVYRDLDIVCLTSRNEGTPVALIEAMAAGRAVVATDVGGVHDLLDESGGDSAAHQPCGFRVTPRGVLVRPDDAQAFAEALGMLVSDGMLRRRLGDAARAYVVERFSADRLVREIAALYEQELARRDACVR